jgi:hypothetical protein
MSSFPQGEDAPSPLWRLIMGSRLSYKFRVEFCVLKRTRVHSVLQVWFVLWEVDTIVMKGSKLFLIQY